MHKWFVSVKITSDSDIGVIDCFSPSHSDIIISHFPSNDVIISLKSDEIPNKDFVLIYKDSDMFKPRNIRIS